MSALVLAEVEVTDPAVVDDYLALTIPSIDDFGGKYLVRSRIPDPLEGNWSRQRIVILEFPDLDTAHAWYNSDSYRRARAVGQPGMIRRFAIVESESFVTEALS